MAFIATQEEVIRCRDLDALSEAETSFNKICKTYKDVMKDNFEYDIDVDYETLDISIKMEFKQEENDNSEGDPKLN